MIYSNNMDKQFTFEEKLILENSLLRLKNHDLYISAKKLVDSSRKIGKSGSQAAVLMGYVLELKDKIEEYEKERAEEMLSKREKDLKEKNLIKIL